METILPAITAGSLIVAIVMSVAALRLARAERARASARVAALAAAASAPEAAGDRAAAQLAPAAAARLSAAVGAPAAPAAEPGARVSTFAPARPAARAAAARAPELAMYPGEDELPPRSASPPAPAAASPPMADSFLGVAAHEPRAGAQRVLAAAAVVLFVVLGTAGYWLISRGSPTAAQAQAVAATASAPLELIALRHERQGGRLTLSGLVRNPAAGAALEGLTAVVFLFDAQGGFISSARAGVDFKRLAAGDESPFVVVVDAPPQVARYRVSFRTEAGVVTHVDRRAEQTAATALASGTK